MSASESKPRVINIRSRNAVFSVFGNYSDYELRLPTKTARRTTEWWMCSGTLQRKVSFLWKVPPPFGVHLLPPVVKVCCHCRTHILLFNILRSPLAIMHRHHHIWFANRENRSCVAQTTMSIICSHNCCCNRINSDFICSQRSNYAAWCKT